MISQSKFRKTPLEAFINQDKSDQQADKLLTQSYRVQRQNFLINRLQFLSLIMLVLTAALTTFFALQAASIEGKFAGFKLGTVIGFFMLFCWILCKTPIGCRYPHLILLSLCWSVTCVVQIDIALLYSVLEPNTNTWKLTFLTLAVIVPVLWKIHLLAQVGTIVCYLILYYIYHPTLKESWAFYEEQALFVLITGVICVLSVYFYEKLRKKEFYATQKLELSEQQSEKLLLNIFPAMIASKLKNEDTTIADSFAKVTVIFADIVGFTELSTRISPSELVELLNEIFCLFDELAERHGVEKIKTIGDAYMAVAGLPYDRSDHALAIANMALDMQTAIAQFNEENNQSFRIRIGISTGLSSCRSDWVEKICL